MLVIIVVSVAFYSFPASAAESYLYYHTGHTDWVGITDGTNSRLRNINAQSLLLGHIGEEWGGTSVLIANQSGGVCTGKIRAQISYNGCGSVCVLTSDSPAFELEDDASAWVEIEFSGTVAGASTSDPFGINYYPQDLSGCNGNNLLVAWHFEGNDPDWYIYSYPNYELAASLWTQGELDPREAPTTHIYSPTDLNSFNVGEAVPYIGLTSIRTQEYPDEVVSSLYSVYSGEDLIFSGGGEGSAYPCNDNPDEDCWGYEQTIPITFTEGSYEVFGMTAFAGYEAGEFYGGGVFDVGTVGLPDFEGCNLGWGEDFDVVKCAGNLASWLIIPRSGYVDEMLRLIQIEFESSIPFSYYYSVMDAWEDLNIETSDELPSLYFNSAFGTLPLVDLNATVNLIGQSTWDWIQNFMSFLIYLGVLCYVVLRVTRTHLTQL